MVAVIHQLPIWAVLLFYSCKSGRPLGRKRDGRSEEEEGDVTPFQLDSGPA